MKGSLAVLAHILHINMKIYTKDNINRKLSDSMQRSTLLVDFGSTYTKGVVINLESESIIAQSCSLSTVTTDIREGLDILITELRGQASAKTINKSLKLSSSSAAGGLRMVIVGLVPELTLEAGRRAAFNAGAKVVGSFCGVLNSLDIEQLLSLCPDIILLTGGTDGGNKDVIVENADILSGLPFMAPVIIAGNKNVSDLCRNALLAGGHEAVITSNVMPRINTLNIDPAREAIRQVFIDRIAFAKGIGQVKEMIPLMMPTPNAVLQGVSIAALGTQDEIGYGELLAVDVGGATTDIYSVASGAPTMANVILHNSLPEPYVKRSVEGDLGIRHNAESILSLVGESRLTYDADLEPQQSPQVAQYCQTLAPSYLAKDGFEMAVDRAMAMNAVRLAVNRHAGRLETSFVPGVGEVYIQHGKDLRSTRLVIGTGGPIINSDNPKKVLSAAIFDPAEPFCLKPTETKYIIDKNYILYAIGLLANQYPVHALHLAKKYLV